MGCPVPLPGSCCAPGRRGACGQDTWALGGRAVGAAGTKSGDVSEPDTVTSGSGNESASFSARTGVSTDSSLTYKHAGLRCGRSVRGTPAVPATEHDARPANPRGGSPHSSKGPGLPVITRGSGASCWPADDGSWTPCRAPQPQRKAAEGQFPNLSDRPEGAERRAARERRSG